MRAPSRSWFVWAARALGLGVALWAMPACARGTPAARARGDSVVPGAARDTAPPPSTAGPPAPSDSAVRGDSAARPLTGRIIVNQVVVTLDRRALGVADNAPVDSLRAAMLRGLARLKRSVDFEIVAVSPAILAARLRPVRGSDAPTLAAALRKLPSVASSEVEKTARTLP